MKPKLHIGGGRRLLDGWLNTDIELIPNVMRMDATEPFPFAENTFQYLYTEHMIEHVPYQKGARMLQECHRVMRDGAVIQLFGPDEATAFIYALDASGLWGGPPTPGSWGNNQLFPSGPGANIPSATDLDSHWREFFRYFLHYQQVAGQPGHPRPNLIRVWVAAQNWRAEGTYLAWKQNPTAFWNVFDRMVYWAKQAHVYIVR